MLAIGWYSTSLYTNGRDPRLLPIMVILLAVLIAALRPVFAFELQRFYRNRFVWEVSRWFARPFFGFHRFGAFGYLAFVSVLGGHLLWTFDVFATVPRIKLRSLGDALAEQPWAPTAAMLDDLASFKNIREPGTAGPLPFPNLLASVPVEDMEFQNLINAPAHPGLKLWSPSPNRMYRRFACYQAYNAVSPDCTLQLEAPFYVGMAVPTYAPENVQSPYVSTLKGSLQVIQALRIDLGVGPEGIRIRSSSGFSLGSARDLMWQLNGGDMSLGPTPNSLVVPTQDMSKLIARRNSLGLQIVPDLQAMHDRITNYCLFRAQSEADANCPPVSARQTPLVWRCPTGSKGVPVCMPRDGVALSGSWYSDDIGENILPYVPGEPIAQRPLTDATTRAFLALFGRHIGADTVLMPDEVVVLRAVAQQVRHDYAVVMGWNSAGSAAADGDAIEAALVRQPQLLPFYLHRDHWGRIFAELLEEQLHALGFPLVP